MKYSKSLASMPFNDFHLFDSICNFVTHTLIEFGYYIRTIYRNPLSLHKLSNLQQKETNRLLFAVLKSRVVSYDLGKGPHDMKFIPLNFGSFTIVNATSPRQWDATFIVMLASFASNLPKS